MIIKYSRIFKKMFKKQSVLIHYKFGERLELFMKNSHYSLLNNHALSGKWAGGKSINITGDIRAVFEESDGNCVEFVAIGSHSELYS